MSNYLPHAAQRAKSRYDLDLSPQDEVALARIIERGGATRLPHVESRSRENEVWLVRYQGTNLPIVYNPATSAIVSVLPEDYTPLRQPLGRLLAQATGDERRRTRVTLKATIRWPGASNG